MKINQVEELVGITKKNIRFYEEQGLITPERNPQNGYRDYNLKDVDQLIKLKLLRKLAIPIEEIRRLKEGELSFESCMEQQIIRLNHEQHDLELMKELCEKISAEVNDLSHLDASEYLYEMKKMEEGGTRFMDVSREDVKKKKHAPLLAAAVMIAFFAAMLGLIIWANTLEPMPKVLLAFCIILLGVPIVGTLIALKQRLSEIDGGEEDEARKY
jgi:DNA-binding transcriptional MerR regulator